jgi:WD40 repeat protein
VLPSGGLQLQALDNDHRQTRSLATLPTDGPGRGGPVQPDGVAGAAFSPSGRFVFATGRHASGLWDIGHPTRPQLMSTEFSGGGQPVFASERYLLSGDRLYDIGRPQLPVQVLSLPDLPPQARELGEMLSTDARTIVQVLDYRSSHTPGATVRLWNVSVRAHPRLASEWQFGTSSFTRAVLNGSVLAVLTDDGTTRLWDIADVHHHRLLTVLVSQAATASDLAFSPDGRLLATASSSGSVDVWDVSTSAAPVRITTVTGYAGDQAGMAFGPGNRTLVIGNDTGPADGVLQWLTLPESSLVQLTKGSGPRPSFSPDGRTLAVAGWSSTAGFTVGLWDLSKPTAPRREPAIPAAALEAAPTSGTAVFSSAGHVMATSSKQGTTLLDMTDMRHPTTLAVLSGDDRPLMFSPDGRTLVDETRDAHDRMWDVTEPRHPQYLGVLPGTDPGIVSFSPGSLLIAAESAGPAHQVQLWDIRGPRQSHVVARVPIDASALAFAPTGHLLATDARDGTVLLWDESDVAKPTVVGSFPSAPGGNGPVQQMVFSPDAQTLAVSGANHAVQIWDITDPARPALQTMLTGVVSPLAFDPDGHTLAALSTDGYVQVRETDLQRAVSTICASTDPLDKASWNEYLPGRPYERPCP